jgi:hypothetical protein
MCQVLPHLDCEQTVPISSCVTVGILGSRKIANARFEAIVPAAESFQTPTIIVWPLLFQKFFHVEVKGDHDRPTY